jgi:hypothetical protein
MPDTLTAPPAAATVPVDVVAREIRHALVQRGYDPDGSSRVAGVAAVVANDMHSAAAAQRRHICYQRVADALRSDPRDPGEAAVSELAADGDRRDLFLEALMWHRADVENELRRTQADLAAAQQRARDAAVALTSAEDHASHAAGMAGEWERIARRAQARVHAADLVNDAIVADRDAASRSNRHVSDRLAWLLGVWAETPVDSVTHTPDGSLLIHVDEEVHAVEMAARFHDASHHYHYGDGGWIVDVPPFRSVR